MVDESKIIVLGSLSLRGSKQQSRTTSTTDDVLRALSLRASRTKQTNAASDDVLEHSSVAIAGYIHNGGQWENPKDMSYVVVYV